MTTVISKIPLYFNILCFLTQTDNDVIGLDNERGLQQVEEESWTSG